ncbi:LOW QUALITY PROTEIN: olfactory receptor 51Q1-like [Porphyrio hochstetteri]
MDSFPLMLATTELGLLSTLPRVLRLFGLGTREISFPLCLTQISCIFFFMESSVLLAMAFDRYVAICCPLRCSSILTSARITGTGGVMVGCSLTLLPAHPPAHTTPDLQVPHAVPLLLPPPRPDTADPQHLCLSLLCPHGWPVHHTPFGHVLMANFHLLIPPVLNTIIYSRKIKPIHKGLLRLLCQRLA